MLYIFVGICIKCCWGDLRDGYFMEGGGRREFLECFEFKLCKYIIY